MKKIMFKAGFVLLLSSLFFVRCGSSSALSGASGILNSLGGMPNMSSLTNVLKTPGLGDLLKGSVKGPFTMLAPTNDAFSKLGADVLSGLGKPENLNTLANTLKGHIIPGKLDAAGLAKSGLKTAGGKDLNLGGVNLGQLVGGDGFNIIPIDKVLN